MAHPKLGSLKTLKATEVWGNEPQVFTPWLSENLDLLAQALQIDELELKGLEVAAGDFRLDILAEDSQGAPVIIENQFGATDHRHLGQLISYAASQSKPITVVWIAEKFKDDHRAAIDWLNTNTVEDLNFFAVEIEALQIGDSDPAPFFDVVAKPNEWLKAGGAVAREAITGEGAARHKTRIAYWASFGEFLRAKGAPFAIRRSNKNHWFAFPIGRSGIVISATITTRGRIGVELYLHRDPMKLGIRQLKADQSNIEAEFGGPLDWQELPGKKASRIVVYREGVDVSDLSNYEDAHAWMLEKMNAFRRVFGPRVRDLKLDVKPNPTVDPDDEAGFGGRDAPSPF